MSCSRICRSIIAICSGGMFWSRAAACALMRMTSSSNWPRVTSTPLPLATTLLPNRSEVFMAGLAAAAALVAAGWSGRGAPNRERGRQRAAGRVTCIDVFITIFRCLLMLIYNLTTLTLLMSGSF